MSNKVRKTKKARNNPDRVQGDKTGKTSYIKSRGSFTETRKIIYR